MRQIVIILSAVVSIVILVNASVLANTFFHAEVQSLNKKTGIIGINNPKDLLFETIIDIVKNEDIIGFVENYELLIDREMSFSLFYKLFLNNPRLVYSLLLTSPSLSEGYLNFIYDVGSSIFKSVDLSEFKQITTIFNIQNNEVLDEFSYVIKDNDALGNKIEELSYFCCDCDLEGVESSVYWDFPVICTFLFIIFWTIFMIAGVLPGVNIIIEEICFAVADIGQLLDCWWV
jgi:hypothetical protein